MSIKLKFGNHKLGDDTCIFNMGCAKDCPSKALGLCEVVNKGITCYAEKAENQYKEPTINYRKEQEKYWKSQDAITIAQEILNKIKNRRKETRFVRFNESGDFWGQEDVAKLSAVAEHIKHYRDDITIYGYTARSDLDFSKAKFLVKGSYHDKANNGKCIVIGKNESVPEGFIECPGGEQGCARCNLCKIDRKHNIAFRKH